MDASLHAAYEACRQINRRHGRSYYLATRLLAAPERRHVHALYGLARLADEIVDAVDDRPALLRQRQLDWIAKALGLTAGAVPVSDPLSTAAVDMTAVDMNAVDTAAVDTAAVDTADLDMAALTAILPAVRHTIAATGLAATDLTAFLASMSMDLYRHNYATYDDLLEYMGGSAAAIGSMVLPILKPTEPDAAREPARQLGLAFQLTNFIRDIAEDLQRGRIYLPQADLERFSVGPDDLTRAAKTGFPPSRVRALIAFEIQRARKHYAAAAAGPAQLPPASALCVRTAASLYGEILNQIERHDHNVFAGRVRVSRLRRVQLVAANLFHHAKRAVDNKRRARLGPTPGGAPEPTQQYSSTGSSR